VSARRLVAAAVAALASVVVAGPSSEAAAGAAAVPIDYHREMALIDERIAQAEAGELVYLLYSRATLTGDHADLARVEEAIERALAERPAEELYLFRATLAVELHRLAAAKEDLGRLQRFAGSAHARRLAADIALQEGRDGEARRALDELLAEERSWEHLARVAHLEAASGRTARADRLYAEAQDGLTAKQMRTFAWLELQRGLLDLERGRLDAAHAHYVRAERAYPGYWLIEEHRAEVLALLGRRDEAIDIYRRVSDATGDPQFVAALAELVEEGDPGEAADLRRRADAAFEERFARYPEAAIGHYIEHLAARRPPAPGLLELAEENHRLRPNAEAKLLLARVCLALGQERRARELVREIAASPWRPAGFDELRRRLGR
jgi:hypothetical protein